MYNPYSDGAIRHPGAGYSYSANPAYPGMMPARIDYPTPGYPAYPPYAPQRMSIPPGLGSGTLPAASFSPDQTASSAVAPIGSNFPVKDISSLQRESPFEAKISSISDQGPKSFYVTRNDGRIEILEAGIAEYTQASDRLRDVTVAPDYWVHSKVALCYSTTMHRWVRCAVLLTSSDLSAEIFAVDYGWTDYVHLSTLRPIPSSLCQVEPMAVHCSLKNLRTLEVAGLVGAEAKKEFDKLVVEKCIKVAIEYVHPTYYKKTDMPLQAVEVSITVDGKNVVETLLEALSSRKASRSAAPRPQLVFPPNVGPVQKIILTNFDGFNDFYGQFATMPLEAVAQLTLELTTTFKERRPQAVGSGEDLVGKVVAAEFMNEFYRCEITAERDEKNLVGYFLDYGNTADVSRDRTFFLGSAEQKFLSLPVMGMRCRAPGLSRREFTKEERELLDGLEVEVHLRPASGFGKAVASKIEVDVPRNTVNSDFWAVVDSFTQVPQHEMPRSAIREVYLIKYVTADEFYLGLAESALEFDELRKKLKSTSVSTLLGPFLPKRLGTYCVYKRGSNASLYRAVVEVVEPKVAIRCVDFGMVTELMPGDELYAIPEPLTQFKIQAIKCASSVKPPLNAPTDRAFARFVRQGANGAWNVEFLQLSPTSSSVSMASDAMAGLSLGRPNSAASPQVLGKLDSLTIQPGITVSVYVSWFVSPGLVFLCFSENQTRLDNLTRELQGFYGSGGSRVDRGSLKEGGVLCAKFPDDQQWYRAEILEVGQSTTRVLYVDFGNTAQVTGEDVRVLDARFQQLPKQAIPCALHGLTRGPKQPSEKPSDYWARNFRNAEYRATFVEERGEGLRKRWEIKLICDDGRDVADVLLQDGFVTRVGKSPPERAERRSPRGGGVYNIPARRESIGSNQRPSTDNRERGPESRPKPRPNPTGEAPSVRRRDAEQDWKKHSHVSPETKASNSHKTDQEEWGSPRPVATVPTGSKSPAAGKNELAMAYEKANFNLVPSTTVSVFVSHVEDGRDFYVQLNSQYEVIADLAIRVAEAALKSPSRPGTWPKGNPCLAYWMDEASGEAAWYRASIVADDGGALVPVFFVDYGNTGEVERRFIKVLPKEISSPCPQAISMRLKGLEPDSAKQKFEELALNRSFDAKLDAVLGERWCVTLIGDDKRVLNDVLDGAEDEDVEEKEDEADKTQATVETTVAPSTVPPVIQEAVAVGVPTPAVFLAAALPHAEPKLNELTQAYIAVARGVNDVWFQTVEAEPFLTAIARLLVQKCIPALPSTRTHQIGELCVSYYENSFYRAEVLGVSSDGATLQLLLVDYGDILNAELDVVYDFCQELLAIPRQAFQGRLAEAEETLHVYDVPGEAVAKFAGTALVELGHDEPLDVKFSRTDGKTYVVESAVLLRELVGKIKQMAGIKESEEPAQVEVEEGEIVESDDGDESEGTEVADGTFTVDDESENGASSAGVAGADDNRVSCGLAILGDIPSYPVGATITHLVTPSEFYLIPVTHNDAIKRVVEQLLKEKPVKPEAVTVGEVYGMKLDESRIRVKILDATRCQALEKGTIHSYDEDQLFVLPPDSPAALFPPLAVKCHLAGVAPAKSTADVGGGDGSFVADPDNDAWSRDSVNFFKSCVRGSEEILVSLCYKGDTNGVRLYVLDVDAVEELTDEDYGRRTLLPVQLNAGPVEGYLGNVDVIGNHAVIIFFREMDREAYDSLHEQLEMNAVFMRAYEKGPFCAAHVGIEGLTGQKWIRARVLSRDSDDITVWGADCCEEFTVAKRATRELPIGFFQMPTFGTRLIVPLEVDDKNSKVIQSVVANGGFDREGYLAEIVGEAYPGVERLAKLSKLVRGRSIDFADYLLQCSKPVGNGDVRKPIPEFKERMVSVPLTCGGVVTHVVSPSEFWVLRDEDEVALKTLTVELAEFYGDANNRKPEKNLDDGRACILALPEGSFLRAQILKKDKSNLVPIKAVDYGTIHCATRDSLLEIDERFLKDPIFALRCKLNCVLPDDGLWTVEAIEMFEDALGSDRAERHFHVDFKVDMMSEDGTISFVVDLFDTAGVSVAAKLGKTSLVYDGEEFAGAASPLDDGVKNVSEVTSSGMIDTFVGSEVGGLSVYEEESKAESNEDVDAAGSVTAGGNPADGGGAGVEKLAVPKGNVETEADPNPAPKKD